MFTLVVPMKKELKNSVSKRKWKKALELILSLIDLTAIVQVQKGKEGSGQLLILLRRQRTNCKIQTFKNPPKAIKTL